MYNIIRMQLETTQKIFKSCIDHIFKNLTSINNHLKMVTKKFHNNKKQKSAKLGQLNYGTHSTLYAATKTSNALPSKSKNSR